MTAGRERRPLWNLTWGATIWLGVGIILLAYEIVAVWTRQVDVLTDAWRRHALQHVAIPIGSGVLMGHLNGPSLKYLVPWSPMIWAATMVGAVAWGIWGRALPEGYRAPLFGLGFCLGVLTWSGRP